MASGSAPTAEGAIELESGRKLSYAQWGASSDRPVLCFHGCPGSRYLAVGTDWAEVIGVRLICLERPGLGLSDPAPDRTITTWPHDVAGFADRLGLDEFAVVGSSAGSPYVLACAAVLADRVTHAGVVAGLVPPEFYENDDLVELLARDPSEGEGRVRQYFEAFSADLEGSVDKMSAGSSPDAAIYRRPQVRAMFLLARQEAFRQGIEGAITDLLLVNQSWGFSLSEIRTQVFWWHGELDPITPLATAREAIRGAPDCRLTVYPGEGHAIGFVHGEQILQALLR